MRNSIHRLAAKGFNSMLPKATKAAHKLPQSIQQRMMGNLLHQVLKESIVEGDLDCLNGNWLEVHVTDAGISWYFTLQGTQLVVQKDQPLMLSDNNSSRIAGKSDDLLRLLSRQQDPDTLFFQRRLELSGNTELGLEIRNVLDAIDMDELPQKMQIAIQVLVTPLNWKPSP